MKDEKQLLKELDQAIDQMDLRAIDDGLDALSAMETNPIAAEDAKLFSARIQKQSKGSFHMQKSRKALKIAVCAAVIMLVGVTAYAAGATRLFQFHTNDQVANIRTTQSMTDKEANELMNTIHDSAEEPNSENTAAPSDYITFDSAQDAAKQMDMQIIMPERMPDLPFESATGNSNDLGNGAKQGTVWLNYGSPEDKLFGMTVSRTILPPDSDTTFYSGAYVDEGSISTYKSKSGMTYTMAKESDPAGEKTATIATISVGEYDYALVFFGFEKAEYEAVIDSLDLSGLQ